MNHSIPNLTEYKIKAALLLKALRSSDPEKNAQATARFQRQLPDLVTPVQLKHALAVIALENGFKSWTDLKTQIRFIIGGFLNKWFVNYADAKNEQRINGGFLLPYKNHFFICNAEYIKQLGFDPSNSDWKLIDFDWAKPSDIQAWKRLNKNWVQLGNTS